MSTSAAPLRAPRQSPPARPRLRLVPPPQPRRGAPRAPFVLLVVTLLGSGLIVLLLLNTAVAQDSFRLTELRQQAAQLDDRQELLQRQIADLSAPQQLAEAAEALGMVPGDVPRFLRTPGGEVLGGTEAGE